ncbi:MAG: UDP-glucose 4-epimerase GalE, partial [Bradymonadaceae bacterium]
TDLADAHLAALAYLRDGGDSFAANCGYGRGFTVREVAETVRRVSGVDFDLRPADPRPGDPPKLVADPSRLHQLLDWTPRHDDLDDIVRTALRWERQLHAS